MLVDTVWTILTGYVKRRAGSSQISLCLYGVRWTNKGLCCLLWRVSVIQVCLQIFEAVYIFVMRLVHGELKMINRHLWALIEHIIYASYNKPFVNTRCKKLNLT